VPVNGADPPAAGEPGAGLVRWDRRGTALFAVVAVAAAAVPDRFARPAAVVDLVLFAVGFVTLLLAYARAIGRSRTEAVDVIGVFLLGGEVAPPHVRRELRALFGVQVAVALVTASIRPYTSVAFGVLVPLYGLGLAGLWGATHGRFGPRVPSRRTGRPPASDPQADLGPDD
jgi:hypothetical protein